MTELAPEMLAANEGAHNVSVPIDFSVFCRREIAVA
jgi:hypothetical protein